MGGTTRSVILGMLAETSIHPGSGQDAGFVDLPVAREAANDYPVIVGSSMKGALLDRARQVLDQPACSRIFGEQASAGQILVGDARLLLLPVRSLQGSFRWVTCPHLLRRLGRDMLRAGIHSDTPELEKVNLGTCLAHADEGDSAFLEERQFTVTGRPDAAVPLISEVLCEAIARELADRLVVLSDDDFAWFARYGLAINARNQLEVETKTSRNLWYEETLPPETLMYCVLSERAGGAVEKLVSAAFADHPYLQAGGNETVGQGWFQIKVLEHSSVKSGGAA